jgi:lysophospholipase L1-like esterase
VFSWKLGLGLFLFNAVTFIVLEAATAPPANNARAFERYCRNTGKRLPILTCLGDSNLHGTMSASITPEIVLQLCESLGLPPPSPRYATFSSSALWVVNCAQNGLTSQTILHERVRTALNVHPDYIFIMIGTNDVLCMHYGPNSSITQHICKTNQLDATPTLASLERNISAILNHIHLASPRVQIGLATLPPISEDLQSSANQLVRQANAAIERAAASFPGPKEYISIIPVYSSLEAVLEKSKKRKGSSIHFFPLLSIWMCYVMYTPIVALTGFLTYDKLACIVGNTYLSDGVHLTEAGRDVIVQLIVDWLNNRNIAKAIAVKSM